MSNITTDFIAATKKIHADVRAILTALHLIREDVKTLRDRSIGDGDKQPSQKQTSDSCTVDSRSSALKTNQSNRDEEESGDDSASGFRGFKERWRKSLRKPIVQLEMAALIGLALYTCETRRTNNLTTKSLDIQLSLSRAFVQITGNEFLKNTLEDALNAGQFYLEIQNVGKLTASKIYGEFVVEFPLASEQPSLVFDNKHHTAIIHSPIFPGTPPTSIGLVDIPEYGNVEGIPSGIIQQLKNGSRYAVIFGRVQYEDAFGKWWTQYCDWKSYRSPGSLPHIAYFAASTCIDFNIEGGSPKRQ
jgi:hypothetical protein